MGRLSRDPGNDATVSTAVGHRASLALPELRAPSESLSFREQLPGALVRSIRGRIDQLPPGILTQVGRGETAGFQGVEVWWKRLDYAIFGGYRPGLA